MKQLFTIVAISAALAMGAAQAATTTFRSTMSGPSEATPNNSPGYGVATIIVDDSAHTMSLHIPFIDLLAPNTASHIHCCTATPLTGTAMVATTVPTFPGFPSGTQAGTYDHVLDLLDPASYNPAFLSANGGTTTGAEAALIAGMLGNESYLNIHSTLYPGGEIRGFLVQIIPEPDMAGMLLGGLATVGIAGWLRRRRAS